MGRGHLSLVLLFAVLAAAASAAAASTIPWRVAAHGVATGAPAPAPVAILATSRPAAARVVARVPASAAAFARGLDYRTNVLVGVLGPFGCTDARVRVSRMVERGRTLLVELVRKPLAPGTAECLAIYTTYRLLVVPRSALAHAPTSAGVTVAGA